MRIWRWFGVVGVPQHVSYCVAFCVLLCVLFTEQNLLYFMAFQPAMKQNIHAAHVVHYLSLFRFFTSIIRVCSREPRMKFIILIQLQQQKMQREMWRISAYFFTSLWNNAKNAAVMAYWNRYNRLFHFCTSTNWPGNSNSESQPQFEQNGSENSIL